MTLTKILTCLAVANSLLSLPAMAQDAAKGEKTFKKCAACHEVGEGAKNKTGPVLTDLIGRAAGSYPDYKFGKSLIAAGEAGLVWDEAQLIAYLENPRNFLRNYLDDKKAKSKMSFKVKKENQRADIAAYLATLAPQETEGEDSAAQ